MAKSKNKNKKNTNNKKVIEEVSINNSGKKVITCIVVVLAVFVSVYLLTLHITKNSTDSVQKKTIENTTLQYDEIIAGTSFKQEDNEYLVLFYNVSNDTNSTVYSLKSEYEAKDDSLPMYYVDLGNSLNSSIVSSEDNKEATNATELKVTNPTLIKFVNGSIEDYIVGEEEIKSYLN